MRTHTWKTLSRLLFAGLMGTPLFVSMPAVAATPDLNVASEKPNHEVCTKESCAAPGGGELLSPADSKLGTAITWAPSPDAAWRAAVDQGKLVFMIQVSGNFARPEFT